jgi:hypothetical protein
MNYQNKAVITHYFWAFVVILASIRGVFVFHLSMPAKELYIATSIMLVLFGALSFSKMLRSYAYSELTLLKKIIKVNVFLLGFYALIYITLMDVDYYVIAYQFLIFPAIFFLIKYENKLLHLIVIIISLITAIGIFYFYNIGITGGFDDLATANLKLRPDNLMYSRIGDNLLPAGYQGNHHDAANIMVMCSLYFLSQAIILKSRLKSLFCIFIYLICMFSLFLTGSAANIIITLFVSAFALCVYTKNYPWIATIYIFLFALLSLQYFDSFLPYLYFFEKFSVSQRDLDGGGMFNSLNLASFFSSLHAILFGFGQIFEVPMIKSEIAFIKLLVDVGFIPFLALLFILFSPYFYLYKFSIKANSQVKSLKMHRSRIFSSIYSSLFRESQYRLLMAAMPCLAGTLTLLHYGSLFRITSVGLFCVLLALFYKEYLASKESLERQWSLYKLNF